MDSSLIRFHDRNNVAHLIEGEPTEDCFKIINHIFDMSKDERSKITVGVNEPFNALVAHAMQQLEITEWPTAYINYAIEAINGYWAVAYGPDYLTGDSQFSCDSFPCDKDDFDSLFDAWLKADETASDYESLKAMEDDCIETPVGFWLIDFKFARAMKCADFYCGSDSALYSVVHGMKSMTEAMANKTVTKE